MLLLFSESRVARGGVRHYDVMRSEGDDARPAECVSGRHPSFRLVCRKNRGLFTFPDPDSDPIPGC